MTFIEHKFRSPLNVLRRQVNRQCSRYVFRHPGASWKHPETCLQNVVQPVNCSRQKDRWLQASINVVFVRRTASWQVTADRSRRDIGTGMLQGTMWLGHASTYIPEYQSCTECFAELVASVNCATTLASCVQLS